LYSYDKSVIASAKKSLQKSLAHGLPWISGMSGSTCIDLHAWEYFNSESNDQIDLKASFLGFLMFLVYDGGHSMHEPMWAASQLEEVLHLNFNFSRASEPIEDFVADFKLLRDLYSGTMRIRISEAITKSFDKSVDYFNTYSFYA